MLETHIVLYSDELSEELKRSAYHSGVSAIIPYPFKFEELLNVLASVFAKESGNTTIPDTIPLADLLQLIGMGNHSTDIIIINKKKRGGLFESAKEISLRRKLPGCKE